MTFIYIFYCVKIGQHSVNFRKTSIFSIALANFNVFILLTNISTPCIILCNMHCARILVRCNSFVLKALQKSSGEMIS